MLGAMQQPSRYFVTGLTTDGASLRTEADSPSDAIQLAGQWVEAGISDVQIVSDLVFREAPSGKDQTT